MLFWAGGALWAGRVRWCAHHALPAGDVHGGFRRVLHKLVGRSWPWPEGMRAHGSVFALCPFVPHYVVAEWKDTTFSIVLTYFTLVFIDAVMLKGWPGILGAKVCAGALLVTFARNNGNGIYIALLALVVLVSIHR